MVYERANHCCERCGHHAEGGSLHHRSARRMGGSRDPRKNAAFNLVLLCGSGTTGCHGEVESKDPAHYADGWLVRHGDDPEQLSIPHVHLGRVWLTEDGGYTFDAPVPA